MLLSTFLHVSALVAPLVLGDTTRKNGLDGPYGPVDRNSFDPNTTYFYPQPPLPRKKAVNDPQSFTLSKDFVISGIPQTREFYWTIDVAQAAPGGYLRQIYAVNGRFPGPLIEANEGDRIIVHVKNNLRIPQSIHWHGMNQNGTNYMDGVPGVSQCPIPPGGSYTYDFRIEDQYGSYWWHSHEHNTLADGLVGGLIVHSYRDVYIRGIDFDEEMVLLLQDWQDIQSEDIIQAFRTVHGYKGTAAPPYPDAGLINGVGVTNCSNDDIQDRSLPCHAPAPYEIRVPIGKKIRMRIINTGADAMWSLSIDSHPITVIEIDDTPIFGPQFIHEVGVHVAQRASIIFTSDFGNAKPGDAFWIRSHIVTGHDRCYCLFRAPPLTSARAVLRYVDANGHSPLTALPKTHAWKNLDPKCSDTDRQYPVTPFDPNDFQVPTDNLQTQVLSAAFGVFVDWTGTSFSGFGINNHTATLPLGYPLLQQVLDHRPINNKFMASAHFHEAGTADLIVNNLDGFLTHPFHLHGKKFIIAARGKGTMTVDQWIATRDTAAVKIFPIKRDVLIIELGEYAVLRIPTDNPGVFPLHCHIGWHLSLGKLAAVVYRPKEIRKQHPPWDWKLNCLLTRHNEKDKFGRRRLSPSFTFKRALNRLRGRWTEDQDD